MIARHYKNQTIKFHDTRAFNFLQIIDITQALLHQHCELMLLLHSYDTAFYR